MVWKLFQMNDKVLHSCEEPGINESQCKTLFKGFKCCGTNVILFGTAFLCLTYLKIVCCLKKNYCLQ